MQHVDRHHKDHASVQKVRGIVSHHATIQSRLTCAKFAFVLPFGPHFCIWVLMFDLRREFIRKAGSFTLVHFADLQNLTGANQTEWTIEFVEILLWCCHLIKLRKRPHSPTSPASSNTDS